MIVDEYGLSPIQQGMLFHHLRDARSGIDIVQLVIEYQALPNLARLEAAWQTIMDRHPVLRCAFCWQGVPDPTQRVHDVVRIEIEQRDATDAVAEFLAGDRRRGFDLARPPLMRLTLLHSATGPLRLVWSLHHILMDGRAMILVLNEVERRYRDLASDAVGEPVPALSYKPYVEWIQKLDLSGADEFWRKKLAGLSAPTPLPLESDRQPKDASSHGEVEHQLSEQVTSALRAIARRNDVTLNTIVMAVWAIILGRFSGESEVLFGAMKTTRRSIPDGDRIIGLFLNAMPVRIAVDGATSIIDMLKDLRGEWVSLREFEHTPLVRIKQASSFPSSAQMFDSLVVFEHQGFKAALAALAPEWNDRGVRCLRRTSFGLTLLARGGPAMTLELEFDVQRFSRAAAQRILAHVVQAFTSVAANPDQLIGSLPIIPEDDRQRLLVDWNRTGRAYPRESLAALVEAQVARTPSATAVRFDDRMLTYQELNERANQLARELVKHGAGPEQLIGIFLERSPNMMVALLAVVKTGSAYLPMDPDMPAARLQHMVQDSGLRVVVTQRDLVADLPRFTGGIVAFDDESWQANSSENLNVAVDPACIGYVIYTSGSTGKPKGVQVPYRSLINVLWSIRDWLNFSGSDRLLAVTTISFDIAGADVWMPWLVGATTVLASRQAAADGEQLRRLIDRHHITFMQATPVTWWLLLGARWRGKPDMQVVCTGEAMPRELAARLAPLVARIWNLYGPTETTIWSTGYLVANSHEPVLIGRPVGNTQCYILDERRELCPIGGLGELYIAGDGVARGYFNRPELTNERFVPDPFSRVPGARMYRTGDLARYLADGNIDCLGRTDHQVKIRGFRIELGEIETALKQHPQVHQAVVVARNDTPNEKRLVAYIVPVSGGQIPDRVELRALLRRELPDYMVPADYVALDTLPLSPNGKIDRKALPPPGRSEGPDAESDVYVEPRNDAERRIADIFSRVLRRPQVGVNDDFFELGGHSLAAMQAIALIKSELDVDLSVRVMFQANTVAQIAAHIAHRNATADGQSAEEDWSTCIPLQTAGSKPPLFCVARPNVNALGYVLLSRCLGPDQPVYGLQRRLEEDPQLEFTPEQIRETAEDYVREIRAVQPKGPYFLVGQCQGAYIAFEMVRQLEADGERIGMLGMLDVWPEEDTRYKALFLGYKYTERIWKRLTKRARPNAASTPPPPSAPHVTGHGMRPARSATPSPNRYWPDTNFQPDVILSKIVVFRGLFQPLYRIRDKTMGWRNRTIGAVEVERIPGRHLTYLREPNVSVVARKILRHMHASNGPDV